MISVHQPQLGIFLEVLHHASIVALRRLRHDPSDVRPPKAIPCRGMRISNGIGIPVMRPMMRRPPQHTLLRAGLGEKPHQKLRHPAELVGAVAEITVITRGDSEHSNCVGSDKPCQIRPFEGYPEQEETSEVQRAEGNDGIKVKSSDGCHQ